jgi:hypothetical protein
VHVRKGGGVSHAANGTPCSGAIKTEAGSGQLVCSATETDDQSLG